MRADSRSRNGYWRDVTIRVLCALVVAGPAWAAGDRVTDTNSTESTERWNFRHVPDFAAVSDAKVGAKSLSGTFPFTHHVVLNAPDGEPWNLTRHEKLAFWAKADRPNDNLLVMLCTRGFEHRRDAVVSVTTEWQRFELPFDAQTFAKNVQGDASFSKVAALVFYNNSGFDTRFWIDGLEFIGDKAGETVPVKDLDIPTDGSARVLALSESDPNPHLDQARRERTSFEPQYDLPPLAFNRANAFTDALVNFDEVRGWRAIVRQGDGTFCLSMDQTLRGVPNAKIEITPTGDAPGVVLLPPNPIPVARAFDTVEAWLYGHKAGANVAFYFRRSDGAPLLVGADLSRTGDDVNPKPVSEFWNLVRIVLPRPVEKGAALIGIRIQPNKPAGYKDPTLLIHVDQVRVSLFADALKAPPPEFRNVGKIVENFPTDPDGACPKTVERVRTSVAKTGDAYRLAYVTESGEEVAYLYTPKTGTLGDLTVAPKGRTAFQPAAGSGPVFDFRGVRCDMTADARARAELVSHGIEGDTVRAVWKYSYAADAQTISYEFSLRGKTLRIAAASPDRDLEQWIFGEARGVKDARVIEVPFMLYSPNILLTDGLFVTYYADWYRSNVSMLPYGAENAVKGDTASYNWRRDHKYHYAKRTDGRRHPFQEVFYITASSNVDDVMLTVSNPPSPMKDALKTRLFRMTLASAPGIFRNARALSDQLDAYGMTDCWLLFHAPLFFKRRMGCEGFPGDMNVSLAHEPEGGDRGLQDLFASMRAKGIHPGYYDGYPARDVTSASFHYDWTTYTPNGDWNLMWRCPALKPWSFPELAATLYRDRAKKFGARVSYQDGITAWIITYMQDYDHRDPNSTLLRETMRALATGWQRCRENVDGPVFSEGRGSDFYTAGLNDGDYSKLKGYWDEKPCTEDRVELFVDFRLKKLGPLSAPVSVNIGYAGFAATNKISYERWYAQEESYAHLHHFLAAQIAFATIGMMEPYWPSWSDPKFLFDKTLTCYFMIRQLQERYIMEPVEEVQYWDGTRLLSTSDALRADVVKDNLLRIRYRNGLVIHVNLNWDGKLWAVTEGGKTCELPPGGWVARQGEDFLEFSALVNGARVDFVDSPDYVYLDGHKKSVIVNGYETDRQLVVWKRGPRAGQRRVFPEP